jgi:regulator of sirC expression with transglutaminase-like and TPR domain
MQSAGDMAATEQLSESRRLALLNLLADEDPAVYRTVREKILSCGPSAAEWLRPHVLSRDPTLRRRAQELVLHFDRQLADNHFLAFCLKQGEECDLEQGAWLLAQTQYPQINVEAHQALLDSYGADLRERLVFCAEGEALLTAINQYFFSDLGFSTNQEEYYNPDNCYLNRVIDRRTGNPISMCLVYLLLARRLRLPITGIGLPGHFLCRYQCSTGDIYVDVFNRGKFLSKGDCVQYLLQGNYSLKEDYLTPVTPRRMLLRMCSNLHQIYLHHESTEEATRFQRYLVALAR